MRGWQIPNLVQADYKIRLNFFASKFPKPFRIAEKKRTFAEMLSKMLQAASIYTQGNGDSWNAVKMFEIMLEISKTSLQVLGSDLFKQLTKK